MGKYIMALDQGTTSSRTILFDKNGKIVCQANKEFEQIFPKPGLVEHNPEEIWMTQLLTMEEIMNVTGIKGSDIDAIGITNQRETTVAWNKTTLESPCHAIVWQCRRTADYCSSIKNKDEIKNRTGLIVDSYFSATKMRWMLNNVPEVRKLDRENNLCFGTIDTFLIAKLTKGKSFYTDVTNASRTMLYNINDLKWDEKLLKQFGININSLPEVKPCNYDFGMAQTIIGEIPILSVIGDQQASLFGQGCFEKGMAKNTYGTGCFILMNIGEQSKLNNKKLLKTIAWQIDDKINYALEGSIFNAGAALEWGNRLGLFKDSRETSALAESVGNNDGLYCVPAFTGLGAPYWDPKAKGIIYGITGGTTKAHVSRAILESMAYSTYDIIHTMESKHINVQELRVDGGVSKNDFLLQFQTNLIRVKLLRQESIEATVLGAIYMAGLNCGVFKNLKDISKHITFTSKFTPNMDEKEAKKLITGWHDAVKRCLNKG